MTPSEKQARLDYLEVRELIPALRDCKDGRGLSVGPFLMKKARRASTALFAADVAFCNYPNQEARRNRATARAVAICGQLNDAMNGGTDNGARAVIHNNGLRYIEIVNAANGHAYELID